MLRRDSQSVSSCQHLPFRATLTSRTMMLTGSSCLDAFNQNMSTTIGCVAKDKLVRCQCVNKMISARPIKCQLLIEMPLQVVTQRHYYEVMATQQQQIQEH